MPSTRLKVQISRGNTAETLYARTNTRTDVLTEYVAAVLRSFIVFDDVELHSFPRVNHLLARQVGS